MIYDDLEYTQEADICANQMTNVKPLHPYEIFNASCEAGNEKELLIKGLVESYDLKISAGTTPGSICAVGALESIYDRYGYEMLDHILHLIIITWEGEQKSFSANMMNGVARLLYAFGDEIKDDVFKDKLGEISVKEITKTAKERRAGSLGFAEAMLLVYSKRMKNPPSWKSLYNPKHKKTKKKVKKIENAKSSDPVKIATESQDEEGIQAG